MGENEVIGDGGDQLTIETLKELGKKPFGKRNLPASAKLKEMPILFLAFHK